MCSKANHKEESVENEKVRNYKDENVENDKDEKVNIKKRTLKIRNRELKMTKKRTSKI